jgi:hypothetical protein
MGQVRGEMGQLRGEMGQLRGEMGELRRDMRTQFYWVMSTLFAIAGLLVSFMGAVIGLLVAR